MYGQIVNTYQIFSAPLVTDYASIFIIPYFIILINIHFKLIILIKIKLQMTIYIEMINVILSLTMF